MIAWRVEHVGQVDSTNAAAMDLVRDGVKKGSEAFSLRGRVIVAAGQSAGRGQHGRAWASPEGGVYMSAILGDLQTELRPLAALLAGVAVAQAIEDQGISHVGLRWPNDVLIDGKKVAGILCEGVAFGPQWICVAGIGVNVNMPVSALPAEIAARATTLFAHDGKVRDVGLVCESILRHLASWMGATPQELIQGIRRRDTLRGKHVTIAGPDGDVAGMADGIDARGALRLAADGGERCVSVGSIIAIDGIPIR